MIVVIFIQCCIKNTCDPCELQKCKEICGTLFTLSRKLDKQKSESLLRNGTLSRPKILVEWSANKLQETCWLHIQSHIQSSYVKCFVCSNQENMSCLLLVDCVKEKAGGLIRGLQVQKGASGRGLLKTTFTEGGIGIFGLLFWLFF